jgi:hypothetical protein
MRGLQDRGAFASPGGSDSLAVLAAHSLAIPVVQGSTEIGTRSGNRSRRETGAAIRYWRFHGDGLSPVKTYSLVARRLGAEPGDHDLLRFLLNR